MPITDAALMNWNAFVLDAPGRHQQSDSKQETTILIMKVDQNIISFTW